MAQEAAPRTIPLEDLFPNASGDGAPRQRRTRQPRTAPTVPGVTKQSFVEAFELASAGFKLAGANDYALTPDEIERMADAWYRLAKEYPSFGKQVIKGNRMTVWGNLILVNAIVVGKRVEMTVDWWQDRQRNKPPKPRPVPRPVQPTPTRTAPVREAVGAAPTAEPAATWGPSTPDTGVIVP